VGRDALFDLAVDRALRYALALGLPWRDAGALREGLEVWYLKTRFASRIPLEAIVAVLTRYPGPGHGWIGGESGAWRRIQDQSSPNKD
jgi:hypothetical protein